MEPSTEPTQAQITRALRLLESQRTASRRYYDAHKADIKARSVTYWQQNRETINARRRERYRAAHPKILVTE